MSIEIIYGRQFIKVGERVIPLVLMGSSNCTEFHSGRDRLERDWTTGFGFFNEALFTPQEIMDKIQTLDDDCDYIRIKGKQSKATVVNYYKNGLKAALTIEEIEERYIWPSLRGYVSVWKDHQNDRYYESSLKSTAEIENWVEQAQKLRAQLLEQTGGNVYITIRFWPNDVLKLKQKYKVKKQPRADVEKPFAITMNIDGNNVYFLRLTKHGLKYTWGKTWAARFATANIVKKKIEAIFTKMGKERSNGFCMSIANILEGGETNE